MKRWLRVAAQQLFRGDFNHVRHGERRLDSLERNTSIGVRRLTSSAIALACVLILQFALPAAGASGPGDEYVPRELLVRFKKGVSVSTAFQMHARTGARVMKTYTIVKNLQLIVLPPGVTVRVALNLYEADDRVLYAEPNFVWHALPEADVVPNDPDYSLLWGMGKIDAPAAWDVNTGSHDVVVFVIDSGGDYAHEDLAGNRWENPGEIPGDGIDNDGNGYVDDIYGIDPYNADSDPMDDYGHGTHVSGTIGAVGNNSVGVVGVNWQATIGWGKFLGATGYGSTSGAIECLEYILNLKNAGVNVVATNNSWGGGGYSQALLDAITAHRAAGILFIASAGNSATDNDSIPQYPCSYRDPGIIAVASTTSTDTLSSFSCYGHRSVDLGAPGSSIYSTIPGNLYDYGSGTSMASPHVTGAIALLAAQNPGLDWRGLRNQILSSGNNIASLDEKTVTGKRLNVYNALTCSSRSIEGIKRPLGSIIWALPGDTILLEYLAIDCASPAAGPFSVIVGGVGSGSVTLRDDGVAPDQAAGDGLFTENWTIPADHYGQYTLEFPNAETVTVNAWKSGSAYEYTSTSFSWRSITGTNLNLWCDEKAQIFLPFPIDITGTEYTSLWVHSKGMITADDAPLDWVNTELPNHRYEVLVATWWDDLCPRRYTSQNVFWGTVGTAPDRELVVEWRDLPWFGGFTNGVRFQVVFPEADGSNGGQILFQYDDVFFTDPSWADRGKSATVGVQDSANSANQFSYNTESLSNNMALLWTMSDTAAVFRVTSTGDVLADGSFYGSGFYSGSADVAEWVSVSEPVEPGDVLELDPDNPCYYRKSQTACSSLVAGVVSTDPGFVLGSEVQGSGVSGVTPDSGLLTPDSALLALIGIVPVKVTNEGGPIQPGDLLVSSSTPGYAMRWEPGAGSPCDLIGKALEPLEEESGIILVLLTTH